MCGCWVLSKSNKHFFLLLFLGTGFLCSFRPVLEATSALNHRADTIDLKIRISYWYLTSAQCSTSIFLITCVHVRDSRDRDYEGICRCTHGSQRITSRSLHGQGRSLWCFWGAAHSKLANPEASMPREAASHLSLGVQGCLQTHFFYILVLRTKLR